MADYKLVPVEPTAGMLAAGKYALEAGCYASGIYADMLAAAPDHIAEARKKVSRPQIREVFLRNGASIPADRDDLPDYVYESVFELLEMTAPAVQGEPVGEVRFELGAPSSIFAELYSETLPSLAPGTKLYTTPQPAPDVAGLVTLLDHAQCPNCDGSGARHDNYGEPEQCQWCHERAEALAAHRSQGGEV